MKKYDFNYWQNEIDNGFENRDKLCDDNIFVFFHIQAPPPCYYTVHDAMNFSSIDKAIGYIQNIIMHMALAEVLDIDCDEAMSLSFDEMTTRYCKNNEYSAEQQKAVDMYRELDHMIYAPEKIAVLWLKDFAKRFGKLFKQCTCSHYCFEIIPPNRSFVNSWEKYFKIDSKNPKSAEELEMLKKALNTGDTELLDELLSDHC